MSRCQRNEILDNEAEALWAYRDDPAVIEKLVLHYKLFAERLSQDLFHKIKHRQMDWDEVKSAGLLGLLQAIQRYTPDSHAAFSSFATWRIRGAILDSARKNDWVPHAVRAKEKRGECSLPLLFPLQPEDIDKLTRESHFPDLEEVGVPRQYHRPLLRAERLSIRSAAIYEGASVGQFLAVMKGALRAAYQL